MSSEPRTRDKILLGKIEGTSGTEESLSVATDAIPVMDLRYKFTGESVQTNEHRGSLSETAPIQAGGYAGFNFGVNLKGSGTGNTPPEAGKLIRACGYQEVTSTAVTGTAQAGGANSITLHSGASATDNLYVGLPIRITAGTGAGLVNIISGYVGSTKVASVGVPWANLPNGVAPDNTSVFSIDAFTRYRPVSTGLETITLAEYQNRATGDSRRSRGCGMAGEMGLRVSPRGLLQATFQFRGIAPADPDDVAHPGTPTYQAVEPVPLRSALAYLGGTLIRMNALEYNTANTVDQFDDPASANGYGVGDVMMRAPTLRLVANLIELATRNAFSDWQAGTPRSLWLRWGPSPGRRISLWLPAIMYTDNEKADTRGYASESMSGRPYTLDGELFLTFH